MSTTPANRAPGRKSPATQVPAKKKRNYLLELLIIIVCGTLLAVLVNTFVAKSFQIPSASMNPFLKNGDYVMAFPLFHPAKDAKRGDVVVFRDPTTWDPQYQGELLIKRVVAVGGDTVSCGGKNEPLQVNGVSLDEGYVKEGSQPCYTEQTKTFSYKVPTGDVFVMGDNRENSADSRFYPQDPFIPASSLIARPMVRYMPLNRFSWFPSEEPVFYKAAEAAQ